MLPLDPHLKSAGSWLNVDTVTVLDPRWTLSLRTGRLVNIAAHGHDAGQYDQFDLNSFQNQGSLSISWHRLLA